MVLKCVAVTAVIVFRLGAQPAAESEFRVSGVVLDSVTGQPLERASVSVSDIRENLQSYVVTDRDGRFTINRGKFPAMVKVWRRGYRSEGGEDIQRLPVNQANPASMTVKLVPLGAVAGKVTDENGEPLMGITVQILSTTVAEGRRRTRQHAAISTNDLGEYRLWHLTPGEYYLKALGRRYVALGVGQMPAVREGELAYGPSYYPQAASQREASRVEVRPGQTMQADFRLTGLRAYVVRGRLRNYASLDGVKVTLLRGRDEVGTRVRVDTATGAFEALDVPPGDYTVVATSEGEVRQRGEAAVSVAAAPVEGVEVRLTTGVTVMGKVITRDPQRERLSSLRLRNLGTTDPDIRIRVYDDSGEFKFENVQPGHYQVMLGGWFDVSDIRSGTTDVLREGLTVSEAGCEPLELALAQETGELEVEVTGQTGKPAVVVLTRTSGELVYSHEIFVRGNEAQGSPMLAPGEYRVHASVMGSQLEYSDPAVLTALEQKGARMVVKAGEKAKATVGLIAAAGGEVSQ